MQIARRRPWVSHQGFSIKPGFSNKALNHANWRLTDLADDVEHANEGIERIRGLMGPVPDDDEEETES